MTGERVHETPRIERYGVVAVISRGEQFLVIRRSQTVIAPGKVCFAGGGIEPGETEEAALVRELDEELGVVIRPVRRLWRSVTRWQHALAWWLVDLAPGAKVCPNPAEVESAFWITAEALLALPDLLDGNQGFVEALCQGKICLDL